GVSAGSITIHATDGSTIDATTGSAALAVSAAVGGSGAMSIAVALAKNDIANDVAAYVTGAGTVHATGTNGIEIKAESSAGITATSTAASVSVGASAFASITLSGAGADAQNVINNKTLAYADHTDLVSHGKVDIEASDSSQITAEVLTTAATLSGGIYSGAVAIGAATASNEIGTATQAAQVHAYMTNASADADGAVTVQATEDATIGADIRSIAAGAAIGLI